MYDVIIVGAGAAGLFCAFQAAQRGHNVLVLEKQARPGLKILISGGGRCNFTNRVVSSSNYVSRNPHFCKSALARYPSADFIEFIERAGIAYHEKHRGQLFCDTSSKEIVNLLLRECEAAGVSIVYGVATTKLERQDDGFEITTPGDRFTTPRVVIATGGLSYERLGATDFGYRVAESFGHTIIPLQAALTPLLWSESDRERWGGLAGISCPVTVKTATQSLNEDLLFTHDGLSGPAILNITLHWQEGEPLWLDFSSQSSLQELLLSQRDSGSKSLVKNALAQHLPSRLAEQLCKLENISQSLDQVSEKRLKQFAAKLHHFEVIPAARDGYHKAEVTKGGVSTDELSSKTMESKLCSGLYFIGEVVDVTGALGGFNFQWAWASAYAAAEAF